MTAAVQATDPIVEHGEGPVYDSDSSVMHWVDLLAGDLMGLAADGTITRWHVGTVAAAWRPRGGGAGVAAVELGFALTEADGTVTTLLEAFSDPAIRMNDGGCDPQGRFYCGTMAYAETPGAGTMYRLDKDLSIHEIFGGVTISNGMVWSRDGARVYYIDTPTRRIDVFDYDGETLHDRRPHITIEDGAGFPDGLTMDAEGGLWVALYDGSAVHHYDEQGALADVISLPATQVTACAFGGPGLDQLYITTSRRDIDTSAQPLAGALFVAGPGVRGAPVLPFGG